MHTPADTREHSHIDTHCLGETADTKAIENNLDIF